MLHVMGWIGGILLAFCVLPEAITTFKTKTCAWSLPTLVMWFLGEIFCFIPIILLVPEGWLILNYGFNIILCSILMYYKIYGKKFRR